MTVKKPLVIVTRKLPDVIETRMRELFETELNLEDEPMPPDALAEAMSRAELSDRPGNSQKIIAHLEGGVVARLNKCQLDWCEVKTGALAGWLPKTSPIGIC